MTKEELLNNENIFTDKDIVKIFNQNKKMRDWFLVELNVLLQGTTRLIAGYKEQKEMICYKNAVTSLQIENAELKEKLKSTNKGLRKVLSKRLKWKRRYYKEKYIRKELKKWLEEDKEKAMCTFGTGRCFNYYDILDKIKELEEGVK